MVLLVSQPLLLHYIDTPSVFVYDQKVDKTASKHWDYSDSCMLIPSLTIDRKRLGSSSNNIGVWHMFCWWAQCQSHLQNQLKVGKWKCHWIKKQIETLWNLLFKQLDSVQYCIIIWVPHFDCTTVSLYSSGTKHLRHSNMISGNHYLIWYKL